MTYNPDNPHRLNPDTLGDDEIRALAGALITATLNGDTEYDLIDGTNRAVYRLLLKQIRKGDTASARTLMADASDEASVAAQIAVSMLRDGRSGLTDTETDTVGDTVTAAAEASYAIGSGAGYRLTTGGGGQIDVLTSAASGRPPGIYFDNPGETLIEFGGHGPVVPAGSPMEKHLDKLKDLADRARLGRSSHEEIEQAIDKLDRESDVDLDSLRDILGQLEQLGQNDKDRINLARRDSFREHSAELMDMLKDSDPIADPALDEWSAARRSPAMRSVLHATDSVRDAISKAAAQGMFGDGPDARRLASTLHATAPADEPNRHHRTMPMHEALGRGFLGDDYDNGVREAAFDYGSVGASVDVMTSEDEAELGTWVTDRDTGRRHRWPGPPERFTITPERVPDDNGWTPPSPSDLPRMRRKISDWLISVDGNQEIAKALYAGSWIIQPMVIPEALSPVQRTRLENTARQLAYPGGLQAMVEDEEGTARLNAAILCVNEHRRLYDAPLYYLDEKPTAVAYKLGQKPVKETITIDRAPSKSGFMMFARPIGYYENAVSLRPFDESLPMLQARVPIVAVSWSLWHPGDEKQSYTPLWMNSAGGGEPTLFRPGGDWIWFTFYAQHQSAMGDLKDSDLVWQAGGLGLVTAGQYRQMERDHVKALPLSWETENAIRVGTTMQEIGENWGDDHQRSLMATVYSAWQLIEQERGKMLEIKSVSVDAPPSTVKGQAKRGKKAPKPKSDRVSVVKIAPRKAPSIRPSGPDERERNEYGHLRDHDHSWLVDEHKRNVCQNPRAHAEGDCTHKERIIFPYIAGPWDKPLKVSQRVKRLTDADETE